MFENLLGWVRKWWARLTGVSDPEPDPVRLRQEPYQAPPGWRVLGSASSDASAAPREPVTVIDHPVHREPLRRETRVVVRERQSRFKNEDRRRAVRNARRVRKMKRGF